MAQIASCHRRISLLWPHAVYTYAMATCNVHICYEHMQHRQRHTNTHILSGMLCDQPEPVIKANDHLYENQSAVQSGIPSL